MKMIKNEKHKIHQLISIQIEMIMFFFGLIYSGPIKNHLYMSLPVCIAQEKRIQCLRISGEKTLIFHHH